MYRPPPSLFSCVLFFSHDSDKLPHFPFSLNTAHSRRQHLHTCLGPVKQETVHKHQSGLKESDQPAAHATRNNYYRLCWGNTMFSVILKQMLGAGIKFKIMGSLRYPMLKIVELTV